MKQILNRLINHENISTEEAKQVLVNISKGDYNQSQIAAFLTVYLMRSITVEELQGFREALLELCIPVNVSDYNTIDLCGTGGDGKNTFNISTLASFITAGAGVNVTKHGNYGVSSVSGSSNVMAFFGIKFSQDEAFLKTCLDKANICVLHAPLFHPAMKHVAPIRRELGVKTFFNMLGPMVNPAFPKNQLVGVFNLELLRLYSYLYQKTDKNYCIVHAIDGYDEVSLTGNTKVVKNNGETILTPSHFNSEALKPTDVYGGNSIESSAKIFNDILSGKGTEAQNKVVCANAALAISTVKNTSIADSYLMAQESLKSGRAKASFNTLIQLSQ
ncbi:anthranilate phosphoribosyltransferase [Mangrovimonas yunxiaonensis]|uniref:Anthranilate phosphoribosyltransferase n=1 Tax=Mangrovimonas yunxiaonensis TaxID=1197477 RepID=A0A084TNW1_9FLAO|nr:anthranilate phosphoribosyltransferase [Mangrovimonas yunxiaonensis]KFB02397.1 anthranilate phosphoribosyltransferase [Mangrovimonas yunxiaonensis]GGH40091.1 anthranilate phosphoribosyltransferase [Mangrovimonas yunxiaonensis]